MALADLAELDASSTLSGLTGRQQGELALVTASSSGGNEQMEFKKAMQSWCQEIIDEHGGPEQYLKNMLPSVEDRADFAKHLWETYPEQEDTVYAHGSLLPAVEEGERGKTLPTVVHVGALGYDRLCSVKPEPQAKVCKELVELILQDGFVTSGEPLLVTQPQGLSPNGLCVYWAAPSDKQSLSTASLGYVKGMARGCVVLMILHLARARGLKLEQLHPRLHNSVLRVYVYHSPQSTRRAEAITNMQLSCRGSIRKPPNVITFAAMAVNLAENGDADFGSFVKDWNQVSGRTHMIIGQKFSTRKLLMEAAPRRGLDRIACASYPLARECRR